jgi:hypothetical protein
MKHVRTLATSTLVIGLALAACGPAVAQQDARVEACGPLANAYGPFDYRNQRHLLDIVEQYHFTPAVENLIKPMFQYFAADFDYTLRASPNHHRALVTMARYSLRVKNPKPPGAQYSVDCYFDRAMRFRRDDLIVRMIYSDYLAKTNRASDAIAQLDYVMANAGDNPFTVHNAGLIYFELKAFDKARASVQRAQQLGFTRTELRDQLAAAGHWTEPAAAAAKSDAPAAAEPAASVPKS